MRVFVYFNLHRHCWSIKALEGINRGRVVAHARAFTVEGATFKVSEAGRQRVLQEQRKNVHAGIVGHLVDLVPLESLAEEAWPELPVGGACDVSYNPYRGPSFYRKGDNQNVSSAARVVAWDRTVRALEAA